MVSRLNRNSPLPTQVGGQVQDNALQRVLDTIITPLQAVLEFLQPYVQPDPWHKPSFGTGWQDYTGGAGYQTSAYKKDSLGRVHLRGLVERASGALTVIMTLPVGYRPASGKIFATTGSGGVARVNVTAGGVVEYSSGGVTFLSLEGISFDTEA